MHLVLFLALGLLAVALDEMVWRQDVILSDESPLDLNQAERQIELLTQDP